MREKQQRLIISFPSTTAAMAFQSLCAQKHIEGRLIPLPPQVHAGCGLAWSCAPEHQALIDTFIKQHKLEVESSQFVFLLV